MGAKYFAPRIIATPKDEPGFGFFLKNSGNSEVGGESSKG